MNVYLVNVLVCGIYNQWMKWFDSKLSSYFFFLFFFEKKFTAKNWIHNEQNSWISWKQNKVDKLLNQNYKII